MKTSLKNTLPKATAVEITHTYTNPRTDTPHYAIIFKGIPYFTTNRQRLMSEVIFHDCTFSPKLNIKNKKIPNFQSFICTNSFSFIYHEKKGTSQIITIFRTTKGD